MSTRLSLFKKYYNVIAINLNREQKLHADPKAIQQINFTRNLQNAEGPTTIFITKEATENIFCMFQK